MTLVIETGVNRPICSSFSCNCKWPKNSPANYEDYSFDSIGSMFLGPHTIQVGQERVAVSQGFYFCLPTTLCQQHWLSSKQRHVSYQKTSMITD